MQISIYKVSIALPINAAGLQVRIGSDALVVVGTHHTK